jgi:hypothetical protein
MKITDAELIHLVWLEQLRTVASGVLNDYTRDRTGLCCNDDSGYFIASDIHIAHRSRITDRISTAHLRKRLVRLIGSGTFVWAFSKCTFLIDSDAAKAAFKDAREFWLSAGVPEGSSNGSMNVIDNSSIKLEELTEELQKLLIQKYGAEV